MWITAASVDTLLIRFLTAEIYQLISPVEDTTVEHHIIYIILLSCNINPIKDKVVVMNHKNQLQIQKQVKQQMTLLVRLLVLEMIINPLISRLINQQIMLEMISLPTVINLLVMVTNPLMINLAIQLLVLLFLLAKNLILLIVRVTLLIKTIRFSKKPQKLKNILLFLINILLLPIF